MKCFEFEATYRCNTVCQYCNRLLGVIDLQDSDMTMDQVRYACQQLKLHDWVPDKIKLSGGEPRMNPDLDEIREYIKAELKPHRLWTLTNGAGDLESKFVHLDGHKWHANPLPKQNHDPFLISPVDCGMEDELDIPNCKTRRICGRAVDAYGFSFCPLAPMLGRLLRINPYKDTPYMEQNPEICKHCPDALREEPRQQLFQIALDGNYPSKTLKEGLKAYKDDPFTFPRMAGLSERESVSDEPLEPSGVGDA